MCGSSLGSRVGAPLGHVQQGRMRHATGADLQRLNFGGGVALGQAAQVLHNLAVDVPIGERVR